jgi:hypothetical protein
MSLAATPFGKPRAVAAVFSSGPFDPNQLAKNRCYIAGNLVVLGSNCGNFFIRHQVQGNSQLVAIL